MAIFQHEKSRTSRLGQAKGGWRLNIDFLTQFHPGQGGEGEGERVKGKREEGVEPDGDV
jgi:hypothetical protein